MALQLQDLLSRYDGQLVDGCGSADCHELLCDTGKRNNTDRPVRKWTTRSARAIALATVSGPTPHQHLCTYYKDHSRESVAHERDNEESPDDRRDPSSFQQLFSDTTTIRKICMLQVCSIKLDPTGLEHHVRAVKRLLVPLSSGGGEVVSNKTAAGLLNAALQACLADAPVGPPQQYLFADRFIGAGHAYPPDDKQPPADAKWNIWLRILDYIEIETPASRLLVQILQVLASRAQLDYQISDLKKRMLEPGAGLLTPNGPSSATEPVGHPVGDADLMTHERLCSYHSRATIMQLAAHFNWMKESTWLCLVLWLKKLFLTHWDNSPVLQQDSVAYASLFLIDALKEYTNYKFQTMKDYFLIRSVPRQLSSVEVAKSWTELAGPCVMYGRSHVPWPVMSHGFGHLRNSALHDEVVLSFDSATCHLLQFEFLFTPGQRASYFRAMNWRRMLKASAMSDKASSHRMRTDLFSVRNQEPVGRVKHNEERALVLKVRRDHVLQDAHDQLWQRREEELFRPLRVWMAEADDLELGQDLGGVQIEFFNLVCRAALVEDADMFVTNETNGTSYFKPGSMQPLHQFELFGVLIALAVYNGIALPMNMPESFYHILLSGHNLPSSGLWTYSFNSDWPIEARSLEYMVEQADPDTENSFSLEANGLRISAAYGGRTDTSVHTMNVYHAVPMHASSSSIDISELIWPGWKLAQMPEDAPPVIDWKKFSHDYMLWMVYHSVAPQWEAFLKGFYVIIDRRTLSIFNPAELKLHIEGTTRLDIRELRRATRYEGYVGSEPYIQAFWRVISTWDEAEQLELVKFVTAAERVPMGGASELTFVIQHTPGDDDERLPTSSTCFGTLNLPVYSSADILNTKLTMAVKYGMEGFGVA